MPDSVSEPLVNTKFPFAPLITPANVPFALEIVRVWLPKITDPAEVPVRLVMVYPYFVSNTILAFIIGIALTAALYFWRD